MPLNKKQFELLTPKSTYWINKNDLYDCALLLNKGYSLTNTLEILGGYDDVIQELNKGRNIREFIKKKSNDSFYNTLEFFLDVSTFDQAIISAFEYHQMKNSMKEKWLKEISYPIFVLLFSIVVFFIFDLMIYPQLKQLIQSNQSSILHLFLQVFIQLIWILLFIICISIIFIRYIVHKKPSLFQDLYEKYIGKLSIIKKIVSYDYCLHTLVLMRRGYSTKQIFENLFKLKHQQMLSFDLNNMMKDLNQGKEMLSIILSQSHFDSKFKYFYKIGYYTSTLEETLNDYCTYQEKQFIQQLKKSSKLISLIAYSFIAILVVSIYQLLLIPLDMMNQL